MLGFGVVLELLPDLFADSNGEVIGAANFAVFFPPAGIGRGRHNPAAAVRFAVEAINFGGVAAKVADDGDLVRVESDRGKSAGKLVDRVGDNVGSVNIGISHFFPFQIRLVVSRIERAPRSTLSISILPIFNFGNTKKGGKGNFLKSFL